MQMTISITSLGRKLVRIRIQDAVSGSVILGGVLF